MPIKYDEAYVAKYRKLAVTDIANFQVGKTYYRFGYANPFVLHDLFTNFASYNNIGLEWHGSEEEGNKINWFQTKGLDGLLSDKVESLQDNNIGADYNPWLIFDNEKTAKEYNAGLKIGYERDPKTEWISYYDLD